MSVDFYAGVAKAQNKRRWSSNLPQKPQRRQTFPTMPAIAEIEHSKPEAVLECDEIEMLKSELLAKCGEWKNNGNKSPGFSLGKRAAKSRAIDDYYGLGWENASNAPHSPRLTYDIAGSPTQNSNSAIPGEDDNQALSIVAGGDSTVKFPERTYPSSASASPTFTMFKELSEVSNSITKLLEQLEMEIAQVTAEEERLAASSYWFIIWTYCVECLFALFGAKLQIDSCARNDSGGFDAAWQTFEKQD